MAALGGGPGSRSLSCEICANSVGFIWEKLGYRIHSEHNRPTMRFESVLKAYKFARGACIGWACTLLSERVSASGTLLKYTLGVILDPTSYTDPLI